MVLIFCLPSQVYRRVTSMSRASEDSEYDCTLQEVHDILSRRRMHLFPVVLQLIDCETSAYRRHSR